MTSAEKQDAAVLKAMLIGALFVAGLCFAIDSRSCENPRLDELRRDLREAQREMACRIDPKRCSDIPQPEGGTK